MQQSPANPNYINFVKDYQTGLSPLISFRFSADLLTPVKAFLQIQTLGPYCFLLESVHQAKTRARYSFIGWQPLIVWRAYSDKVAHGKPNSDKKIIWQEQADKNPLLDLEKLLANIATNIPEHLPAAASGLFGFLSYEAIRFIEKIPSPEQTLTATPDGMYFLPQQVLIFDSFNDSVTLVVRAEWNKDKSVEIAKTESLAMMDKTLALLQGVGSLKLPMLDSNLPVNSKPIDKKREDLITKNIAQISPAIYQTWVKKAKSYINAGDIFQVVLSQPFMLDSPYPPFAFYRALRSVNPSPYMFYFQWDGFAFAGASPETLVKVEQGQVSIYPIAGTRKRGKNSQEDIALAQDLLNDTKEKAEHLMLLDLGRNDVGKIAKLGSVKVVRQFEVEYYSHVMHLVSEVVGQLAMDKTSLDALLSGLPAGTVSGAPKIRAMEIIAELEATKRGLYAGAVGYFSAGLKNHRTHYDMDHCIALRSALLINGKIHMQTGAGIVYDSKPEQEQQECINKVSALLVAAKLQPQFCDN